MNLPLDIIDFINAHFIEQEHYLAITLLESAVLHDGSIPNARLLRCAVFASQGNVQRLSRYIKDIAIDYRNVIVEGEYEVKEGKLIKTYNFEQPFINH